MQSSLGFLLKRRKITQQYLCDLLREKYNLALSANCVGLYCRNIGVGKSANWNTIRLCLKQEFGIEYKNGRWQEVN